MSGSLHGGVLETPYPARKACCGCRNVLDYARAIQLALDDVAFLCFRLPTFRNHPSKAPPELQLGRLVQPTWRVRGAHKRQVVSLLISASLMLADWMINAIIYYCR